MKSYIGKVVFVEQVDQKSTYKNGEYIIVEQSPHNLYGIKPVAGYAGHQREALPLVGAGAFNVIRETDDPAFIKRFATDLRHFADTTKRGEKAQWVESVYSDARRNADILDRLVACECSSETPQRQTHVVGNTRVTVIIEPI